jgi:hypothetical protein
MIENVENDRSFAYTKQSCIRFEKSGTHKEDIFTPCFQRFRFIH